MTNQWFILIIITKNITYNRRKHGSSHNMFENLKTRKFLLKSGKPYKNPLIEKKPSGEISSRSLVLFQNRLIKNL